MAEGKLVLYDHPVSSNAVKVRFLLAELGLEYERVHVPFAQPRPEALLAVNPFGRIPGLVDGDLRMGESNAILRYLAHRENRYDLYPLEPAGRARVDFALDAWSTLIRPGLGALEVAGLLYRDRETGGGPVEKADQDAVKAAIPGAEAALDLFERFVADNGTILGHFTIADCCVAPVIWRTYRLPLPMERWPKLTRVRDTVTARPAWAAAGPVA